MLSQTARPLDRQSGKMTAPRSLFPPNLVRGMWLFSFSGGIRLVGLEWPLVKLTRVRFHCREVNFSHFSHIWLLPSYLGGVRSRFRRVLSSLWSKRISAQGSLFLGPGPAGHHLRYHGGIFGLRKVVFESDFTFCVSFLEFW